MLQEEVDIPSSNRRLVGHDVLVDGLNHQGGIGLLQQKGLTLVPIKVYTKRNLIKLEFGIGKGKKKVDKREALKKRETDRQIRQVLKNTKYPK